MDLISINEELKHKSPNEIIRWALNISMRPILTTNFKPLSASLLHATTQVKEDIPVIWVDSGYNTTNTYRHAIKMMEQLNLNMDIFGPEQSVALRDIVMGIPDVNTKEHQEFTEQVKLEPFARAMEKHQPDVWFTNLRYGQTELRSTMNIVNRTKDGILKVCPFFHWTDGEIMQYIESYGLESEEKYFDPTKVLSNRECGLHQ